MTPRSGSRISRLSLKTKDTTKTKPTKEQVLAVSADLGAMLTGLSEGATGFTAMAIDETTLDHLLTDRAKAKLTDINLTAILPPQIKARRTVFIRLLDRYITDRTLDSIKTEIKDKNGLDCAELFKIGTVKATLKLTMKTTADAKKLTDEGLVLFNFRVAPEQCELERYTHVLICYKCYKYEDHLTKDCRQDYDICSECGLRGHTYRMYPYATRDTEPCS